MKKVLTMVAGALLLMSGASLASEEHGHGHGKHHTDAQMAKLHKMMPKYLKARVQIKAALEKGDLKAVGKETSYLISTMPDLKKSKPHKNLTELEEFKQIAARFEQDVANTADFAKKGDREAAREAFSAAEKRCDECHKLFRNR